MYWLDCKDKLHHYAKLCTFKSILTENTEWVINQRAKNIVIILVPEYKFLKLGEGTSTSHGVLCSFIGEGTVNVGVYGK